MIAIRYNLPLSPPPPRGVVSVDGKYHIYLLTYLLGTHLLAQYLARDELALNKCKNQDGQFIAERYMIRWRMNE